MHIYKNIPIKYIVLWESWIVLNTIYQQKSRLSKMQKRATRVIACSKFNAHTEPLLKSLKLLKLEDLLSLNVLKLYHKLCYCDLPVYITNLFTRIVPGSTHDYDLRPSGILKHPLSILMLLNDMFDLCFQKLLTMPTRVSKSLYALFSRIYKLRQNDKNKLFCYSLSESELLYMPTRMTHP